MSDVLHLTTCARIVQQNTVLLSKQENTKKNYQSISTKLMGSPINSHYNIRGQQSITRLNTLNLLYLFSQMGRDRAQLKTYIYMKQSPFSFFLKCALVKKKDLKTVTSPTVWAVGSCCPLCCDTWHRISDRTRSSGKLPNPHQLTKCHHKVK